MRSNILVSLPLNYLSQPQESLPLQIHPKGYLFLITIYFHGNYNEGRFYDFCMHNKLLYNLRPIAVPNPPFFLQTQLATQVTNINNSYLHVASLHLYADWPNIWNGTEKNSLQINPQQIEKRAIRRTIQRPPNNISIKLPSLCKKNTEKYGSRSQLSLPRKMSLRKLIKAREKRKRQ